MKDELEARHRVSVVLYDKNGVLHPGGQCNCCCGTGRLLAEAGRLHPQAELVGQDIDARCARITAVQLGLRGKYGWVICGNTLSREVQFVYRLGSFFNEGPNGRRRGVIREVSPEECPVLPEITHATRTELFDAIDETPDKEESTTPTSPTILEVPQWAFRLEQSIAPQEAAKVTTESPSKKEVPAKHMEPPTQNDDPPATQQRLF